MWLTKWQRDEPPHKMTRLAIAAETEVDKYDTQTTVICYECGGKEVERTQENVGVLIGSGVEWC